MKNNLAHLHQTIMQISERIEKKRASITICEASVKKKMSFDLNENIEYNEDSELARELSEYRKKVDMNLYYYFMRMR